MSNRNIVIFVKEANEIMFQATLQEVFDKYSEQYDIEVQYQFTNGAREFYTALAILRGK